MSGVAQHIEKVNDSNIFLLVVIVLCQNEFSGMYHYHYILTYQRQSFYILMARDTGCRTRPHIHATDQTLIAVKGRGIVVFVDKIEINSDGKSAIIKPASERSSSSSIELTEGDVVCVPAGTLHWHGALENKSNRSDLFSHLAIRKRTDVETIWF
jgi:quercetin dioxygenase-like cupin family protein